MASVGEMGVSKRDTSHTGQERSQPRVPGGRPEMAVKAPKQVQTLTLEGRREQRLWIQITQSPKLSSVSYRLCDLGGVA